jgi:RimJ/RimL family protein N-acetyltransferase
VSKLWINRTVMNAAFSGVAFGLLGCQMVVLRVSERNRPMIRIARHIGFSEVKIPRLRGRDEAEYIFTLTDDAWRSSRFHRKGNRDGEA